MAYVITDTCTKDEHCIETCPVNCIHPTKDEADFATALQLYAESGGMHRLRGVPAGMPDEFDFCAGRTARGTAGIRGKERGVLQLSLHPVFGQELTRPAVSSWRLHAQLFASRFGSG